jgi:hypothetical protein
MNLLFNLDEEAVVMNSVAAKILRIQGVSFSKTTSNIQ